MHVMSHAPLCTAVDKCVKMRVQELAARPQQLHRKQTSHTHLSHYPTQNPLSYLSILYSPDALFKWVSQSLFWAALHLCMQKRGHWMWEDCNHAFKFFSVCVFLTHPPLYPHTVTHNAFAQAAAPCSATDQYYLRCCCVLVGGRGECALKCHRPN